ncbi:glutamate--cysteine ligase regulatory subunit [Apiospora phragmitis]|uniref:GCS light chain n=1 Tax=Apiospora phragmitis TaxID=2905665 RepID=A0ABR1TRB2_9PEZI
MTRIVLSTGNIISGGPCIIRKPGIFRSNLEFTNSLRSNFVAAQEDYSAAIPNGAATNGTNGINGTDGTNGTNGHSHEHVNDNSDGVNGHHVTDSWTEKEGDILYIPRIDWTGAGLQEERSQYEITVKLFFLPKAPVDQRASYIAEALRLVKKELGVADVDLLIASFPGISFEGDCEWEADKLNAKMGSEADEVATWAALEFLHEQGAIQRLGIAEFGSQKLARFLSQIKTMPEVDQINLKNCCNVPPPLAQLAKEKGIELLTHGDCTDILPSGTLRELLGTGQLGAGILSDDGSDKNGLKGDLIPQWVVKYTAFVKDRGVIENKGYFAGAELVA